MQVKFKHNGDDVKEISKQELDKKNRYEKFEYLFPFYRMDVAGYMFRIRQACHYEYPDKQKIWEVTSIKIDSLRHAFQTHPSWSDLNDDHSDFTNFIMDTMVEEGVDKLNVNKM